MKMALMKNPSHPGELVKANLDELGMNIDDAAKALGITQQQLYDVISSESAVSPEMAIRFEMAFGGGADMWLRLQAAYDLAASAKANQEFQYSPCCSTPTSEHSALISLCNELRDGCVGEAMCLKKAG